MAHPNIDQRRFYVARLLSQGDPINIRTKQQIAERFNCHVSAIYADCKHFEKHGWHWELINGQLGDTQDLGSMDSADYSREDLHHGLIALPFDFRLITYFDEHPDEIYTLTPRQFEEFVAELLSGFGYRVQLGPKGADAGIDIFAEKESVVGPELMLVQCKRYGADRKVGRPVIQQLNANVYDRSASSGMVVTTSHFSQPALEYIRQAQFRLRGTDRFKLQDWIRYHAKRRET